MFLTELASSGDLIQYVTGPLCHPSHLCTFKEVGQFTGGRMTKPFMQASQFHFRECTVDMRVPVDDCMCETAGNWLGHIAPFVDQEVVDVVKVDT